MVIFGVLRGVGASGEDNPQVEIIGPGFHSTLKPALLRLEDVCPGGPFQGQENIEKMRVIADYLYSEGVPFHISLIPRMVVSSKGYDVKITDDTPYAREFVAAIKYMESKGGIVGVHGYTHQTGSQVSGHGFEFYDSKKNPEAPDSLEYARERIKSALDLFRGAGITPSYWETPHYTASLVQYPAFEEQTGLIYENHYRGLNIIKPKICDNKGEENRGFVAVPTPLGYISPDVSTDRMVGTLSRLNGDLASFFYHPFKEFGYIKKEHHRDGKVSFVYDQSSPLHVLIKAFKEKGYTFVTINSLVKYVPAHRLDSLKYEEGDMVLTGRFLDGGRKEILVWNKRSSQWRVYQYTPDWHTPRRIKAFEDRGVIVDSWRLERHSVPLAGDFDGNNKDDLVVFSPSRKSFTLAENKEGKLVPQKDEPLKIPEMKSGYPLAGDFNGDGLCDLAVHDHDAHRLGMAINTTRGFGAVAWFYPDALKNVNTKLFAGDFNGDGRCDILVLGYDNGGVNVLLSDQGRGFTPAAAPWLKTWGTMKRWVPLIADINGDGKSDLVFHNGKQGKWLLAVSDGTRFVNVGSFGPWGKNRSGVPLAEDLNGDKKADLIILDGSRAKGYNLDMAMSVIPERATSH